ncbi:MAG: (deoxy)nucleoside triphosphate pyrophosphohydrolase [Calditrichaceae bacterium]
MKPRIKVVAALIFNESGQILITQRQKDSHLGGYWEFPGGRVEKDETSDEALRREIKEEVDLDIRVDELFWSSTFDYDVKIVEILFYNSTLIDPFQQIIPLEVDDFKWIPLSELHKFQFPEADQALIRQLNSGCLQK